MTHVERPPTRNGFVLAAWIAACAICVASGWLLSLFGAVNTAGYSVLLIVATVFVTASRTGRSLLIGTFSEIIRRVPQRLRSNCKRPLPAIYLLVVLLSFIGGLIHAPNNYDALTYRFSRILHWWSTGSCHWMVTNTPRMNYSAQGFEWLMMPFFIFTKTDRFIFVLNSIAYLLFPGLLFSVFRRLGISARVSWVWMWLLPLGYCYVLQAGSVCNDSIAITFILSSLYYALRARSTRRIQDLWLALIAAGLCSAIKAINVPLYLALAIVILPSLPLLRLRFLASAAIIVVAIAVSFAPTAAINIRHTSTWSGDPLNVEKAQAGNVSSALIGNTIEIAQENLTPPVLPLARRISTLITSHIPPALHNRLAKDFPRFEVRFRELAQEESAGLGLGLVLLIFTTGIAILFTRTSSPRRIIKEPLLVGGAAWIALFLFMAKSGIGPSSGRLLCTYYPLLLLPMLALPANRRLVRNTSWLKFATIAAATALIPLVLTPSRPLLPMLSITTKLLEHHPNNNQLRRAQEVYATYAHRHDALASIREALPAHVAKIGFIGGDDSEYSLWQPLGSRTVEQVLPTNIPNCNLDWLAVRRDMVERNANWNTLLATNNYQIVICTNLISKVAEGPVTWCLLHKLNGPEKLSSTQMSLKQ